MVGNGGRAVGARRKPGPAAFFQSGLNRQDAKAQRALKRLSRIKTNAPAEFLHK
jgi:hypothetical protein